MNFLNVIQSDQARSNNRLEELSPKVTELYEYDEDELLYDRNDDNVNDEVVHNTSKSSQRSNKPDTATNKEENKSFVDDSITDNNNNLGPPAKKQKQVTISQFSNP